MVVAHPSSPCPHITPCTNIACRVHRRDKVEGEEGEQEGEE